MSKIPDHKHSGNELSRLRAQSAIQANNSPIAAIYTKKIAHKAIIILGYALPLVAPFWSIVKSMTNNTDYSMKDFYIMVIPIVIALGIALWIALKRVLSRHNSAFIFMLSLLCCFPVFSAVNSTKSLKYELTGKDVPLEDSEGSLESEEANRSEVLTAADRLALEEHKREREEWLREKAKRDKIETAIKAAEESMPETPNP